ncbi:phosphatidylethanolamine-binding protein [Exophiala viscosa]|uniref:Phosphatidylethanolamine-binding protein n=1 Tax=Exophiala viscosa TaxID=2486360 RepID=A0AAN6E4R0_9EURO|nr:phosphatidylethanolamine-binding protein [Exophiala viscosa]
MQQYLDLVKDASKILGLSYGQKTLESDELVSRTDAANEPQLSFPAGDLSSRYIVVSLDNDAPYASFNILSPILHWIQADLKVSPATNNLTSEGAAVVNWIGPDPPPGSGPHRYVFLLYKQPSNFNSNDHAAPGGQAVRLWPRIRWNLAEWEKKTKVGQPVAVGYFKST